MMCVTLMSGYRGCYVFFFFFKQKTAYEIGTGDWSSDVCSSDLLLFGKSLGLKAVAENHYNSQTVAVAVWVITHRALPAKRHQIIFTELSQSTTYVRPAFFYTKAFVYNSLAISLIVIKLLHPTL